MSELSVVQAARARLKAQWATTDIAEAGIDYEPIAGRPFVRYSPTTLDGHPLSINRHVAREVLIVVDVFVPKGDGEDLGIQYAEQIRAIFELQGFGGVVCRYGSIRKVTGADDVHSQFKVVVPCYMQAQVP
jgi:hypothetical protein